MGEILLPACQFPRLSDGATCRDIQPKALCQACTAHVQVAALRARLESELHAAREQAKFALEFLNERDSARARLGELAAATGAVDSAYRKLHVTEDAAGIDYSMPVSEFDLLGKAIVGLRPVLRRVEADAGEEKRGEERRRNERAIRR